MTKEYFDKRNKISENAELIDSSLEDDWIRKTDVTPDYKKT